MGLIVYILLIAYFASVSVVVSSLWGANCLLGGVRDRASGSLVPDMS